MSYCLVIVLKKIHNSCETLGFCPQTSCLMLHVSLFSSIDQLSEVIRHHIEAGDKLKFELVLVCNEFLKVVYFFVRYLKILPIS